MWKGKVLYGEVVCGNVLFDNVRQGFSECQGGGEATQSPAERFYSSSSLDLGFKLHILYLRFGTAIRYKEM